MRRSDRRVSWGTIPALAWRNCEKPLKTTESVVGVPAEIRTGLLPNTSQKRYCLSQLSPDVSILIDLFGISVAAIDRMREHEGQNHWCLKRDLNNMDEEGIKHGGYKEFEIRRKEWLSVM
jgi:hypothetical protein